MLLLPSLACSQIWLSPLVDDCQTTYLIKLEQKNPGVCMCANLLCMCMCECVLCKFVVYLCVCLCVHVCKCISRGVPTFGKIDPSTAFVPALYKKSKVSTPERW
jgi:hypothetical protein